MTTSAPPPPHPPLFSSLPLPCSSGARDERLPPLSCGDSLRPQSFSLLPLARRQPALPRRDLIAGPPAGGEGAHALARSHPHQPGCFNRAAPAYEGEVGRETLSLRRALGDSRFAVAQGEPCPSPPRIMVAPPSYLLPCPPLPNALPALQPSHARISIPPLPPHFPYLLSSSPITHLAPRTGALPNHFSSRSQVFLLLETHQSDLRLLPTRSPAVPFTDGDVSDAPPLLPHRLPFLICFLPRLPSTKRPLYRGPRSITTIQIPSPILTSPNYHHHCHQAHPKRPQARPRSLFALSSPVLLPCCPPPPLYSPLSPPFTLSSPSSPLLTLFPPDPLLLATPTASLLFSIFTRLIFSFQ